MHDADLVTIKGKAFGPQLGTLGTIIRFWHTSDSLLMLDGGIFPMTGSYVLSRCNRKLEETNDNNPFPTAKARKTVRSINQIID